MRLKTFYEINKKKSIEDKLELIYQTAWIMSCDAFNAGWYDGVHNKDGYEYNESERYAMKRRLRWLCWQIMEDLEKETKQMSKMKDLYIDVCELLEAGMSDEGIAEQLDIPIKIVQGARHMYLEYENSRSEVDEF